MAGKNLTKLPDPEKHRYVSFGKSVVRIAAAGALVVGGLQPLFSETWLIVSGVGFILAELLGVLEEIV